jgi:2-amino-4-hydroxy-6-hydroxymethyldihydropteridine diphosphokinase
MGYADQADFVNAVAEIETSLPASRLLAELKAIEARHGPAQFSRAAAPRPDILLYGSSMNLAHSDAAASAHARAGVCTETPLRGRSGHASIPGVGTVEECLEKQRNN